MKVHKIYKREDRNFKNTLIKYLVLIKSCKVKLLSILLMNRKNKLIEINKCKNSKKKEKIIELLNYLPILISFKLYFI